MKLAIGYSDHRRPGRMRRRSDSPITVASVTSRSFGKSEISEISPTARLLGTSFALSHFDLRIGFGKRMPRGWPASWATSRNRFAKNTFRALSISTSLGRRLRRPHRNRLPGRRLRVAHGGPFPRAPRPCLTPGPPRTPRPSVSDLIGRASSLTPLNPAEGGIATPATSRSAFFGSAGALGAAWRKDFLKNLGGLLQ